MEKSIKKNILFAFAALLIVFCAGGLLVGCGGGTQLYGTWKLDRIVANNQTYNSTNKGEYTSEFDKKIVIKEGGTGTIDLATEQPLTWTQQGSTIAIKVNDTTRNFKLEGSELIYENEGVKYFYKLSS